MKIAPLLLAILFLTGCAMGPNYSPPEPVVGESWTTQPPANLCQSPCAPPPCDWWKVFNDCLLNKYIDLAAQNNNSLLAAEANIWQARALKQVAVSDMLPHISGNFNLLRLHFSENGPFIFDPAIANNFRIPLYQTIYNAMIDATWEIDIFGKRSRNIEAAAANIGSAIEQTHDILISILAEVALNYVELRSYQNRALLVEENIRYLEEYAAVVAMQVKAGYRNRFDLERIEAELATDRANLPNLFALIYQNIYALSILTGHLPETLVSELWPFQPLPLLPRDITVGIRSDVLRRRPDIRRAERQLAAATANIGVAIASFFPTFNLLGFVGLQSLQWNNLFEGNSISWALDGNMSFPVYQGGKLTGNLISSQAQAAVAYFNYKEAVLNALNEAESALVALSREIETAGELSIAVAKYEDLIYLSKERFLKGLINVTELLDIERQWNSAEQDLLISETSALTDLIILYKSLGGGWESYQCSDTIRADIID